MAVEDTQAAAAAPEEGLSLDDSTEAAYGKAPDAAPCGEGADTEAGKTPGVGANEAAVASGIAGAAGTVGGVSIGATDASGAGEAAGEGSDAAEAQQAEPTPEERELAENNALADVFDDVRRQSSDSQLVVPSRWVELGLVPGHMTSDEFEMLVYEYLEDYRRDHKGEIAAEKAERARKASSIRSATRAVGVPPKIPNRRLKQIEEDEKAAREASEAEAGKAVAVDDAKTAAGEAVASDGASASKKPADVVNASVALVSSQVAVDSGSSARSDAMEAPAPHVSETASAAPEVPADPSADSSAADDGPFAGLKLPEGYKLVELEGEYVLVPDEDAAPVKKEIHCEHIVTLVGQHSYYLYDSDLMTKSYAHWAFLAAEDNPLATFVDCVREDGRVYPRPFAAEDLSNPPFRMSASKVEDTWTELQKSGAYPDIERCEASNGDVYFFSTLYMDRTLAESLAEYRSVERLSNV